MHIWAPARAFRSSRLASDEYRSQLITQAKRIIHDDAWAEDIVQSSLESAYRKLNNGQLYALHFFGGYLLIQDGTLPITAHRRRVYTQAIQQLFSNQEPEGLEVIEQPLAWLKKIVENNAKKMYNQQKKYREFCENLTFKLNGSARTCREVLWKERNPSEMRSLSSRWHKLRRFWRLANDRKACRLANLRSFDPAFRFSARFGWSGRSAQTWQQFGDPASHLLRGGRTMLVFPGSESTVRMHVACYKQATRAPDVFLPLEYDPGQDAQVDWVRRVGAYEILV